MRFTIESLWYGQHPLRWLLWPLSWLYQGIVSLRRCYLQAFCQQQFPIPVIIVGNVTVGGVGKTPLVIALVKAFQQKGLRVGVVSRGYKATIKTFPYEVSRHDEAIKVGDEPLLIARKCACPVVIAPKRTQAVRYLLEKCQSQIIISDDGLQHYAMGRTIEIVVIDGVRGFGNNLCLPAGPLRENARRLKKADMLVVNSGEWPNAYPMTLIPGKLTPLDGGETIEQKYLPKPIAAVAAIGHPDRFFTTLSALGMEFHPYAFPDHYRFTTKAMNFNEKTVIMTEKDAVKCQSFAAKNWYFLPVEAQLSDAFWSALWSHERLKGYL